MNAGQKVAYIRDLEGRIVEEIVSPLDAFVVGVRVAPRIFTGDHLIMLS